METNLDETALGKKEYSKEEIRQRLHLYHSTTPEKWERIQAQGGILSEKELLIRGLISEAQLDDLETTSTGEVDRMIGNDEFVFLSPKQETYGDIFLEIDPSILEMPGVIANTAGDSLMFNGPELEDYYKNAQISASQFLDYLVSYINSLPNPEWFFIGNEEELNDLATQAQLEKVFEGKTEKYKQLQALNPEIKVPKEIPLNLIIKVIDKRQGKAD